MSELNGKWILNEDKALKAALTGITVSDDKNPARKVGVWFGQPDVELRQQAYPYITIDLLSAHEATNRAMRGEIELWYQPDGGDPRLPEKGYVTEYPVPYDLTYQVSTFARQPRHDRQLMLAVARRIGARTRSLYIPEDDTQRSMFTYGPNKHDSTEDGRRLFRNNYTVTVYSEILPSEIEFIEKVREVNVLTDASFTIQNTNP